MANQSGEPSAHTYAPVARAGVSFLPRLPEGAYAQMPIEAISEAEYQRRMTALQRLPSPTKPVEHLDDKFCDSDVCSR